MTIKTSTTTDDASGNAIISMAQTRPALGRRNKPQLFTGSNGNPAALIFNRAYDAFVVTVTDAAGSAEAAIKEAVTRAAMVAVTGGRKR